jgi:hypothetical protein
MVRKRAKAACEYAKELNPSLSTWYQNKPTQARSYAGKVLLTIKTPKGPVIDNDCDGDYGAYNRKALDNDCPVPPYQITVDAAKASVMETYNAKVTVSPDITYFISPNAEGQMASQVQAGFARAVRLWGMEGLSSTPQVVIFKRDNLKLELAWLESKAEQLGGLQGMFPDGLSDYFWLKNSGCAAASGTANGKLTLVIAVGCSDPLMNQAPAHEFTRWHQYGNSDSPNYLPVWLAKGSASYYGSVLGYMGLEGISESKDRFFDVPMYQRAALKKLYDELVNAMLARLEDADALTAVKIMDEIETDPRLGYGLGGLATEVLVGVYGHATFDAFLKKSLTKTNWEVNFEESYGLEPRAFYAQLAPYFRAFAAKS